MSVVAPLGGRSAKKLPMITTADLDFDKDLLRFIAKCEEPDPQTGCIEWSACKQQHSQHPELGGYPKFWVGGKTVYAHRWILEKFTGRKLRKGQDADHMCENRCCVNPFHLQGVSHKENVVRISQPWRRLIAAASFDNMEF